MIGDKFSKSGDDEGRIVILQSANIKQNAIRFNPRDNGRSGGAQALFDLLSADC